MLSQVLINVVCLRSVAVAETCDHDLTSALQTQTQAVRHSAADVSASQVDRVFEAIRNTANDAEVICVSAQAGEEAPFPGTFAPASGHKVEVGVGHRAPESGEYCVQNSLVSLMQRATIDGQAKNFEGVVGAKNTEGSTGGKNQKKREVCTENCCGGASNMCKTAVKSDLRSGGDACSDGRNDEEWAAKAEFFGCANISQIDAVCHSDCKMSCDEHLSGTSLNLKNARQQLIAVSAALPAGQFTEMLAAIPSPSAVFCCQPDVSGNCPEVHGRPAMTQADAWDATLAETNKVYKLKDVCTSSNLEVQCAELNKKSP